MLFYPSHDIALAFGVRHFNPPSAALRLQEDLAELADIWNDGYHRARAEGRTVDEDGFPLMPQPWGWDWDTRHHLQNTYGIRRSFLPTDEELQTIRALSSRQQTLPLISALLARPESDSYGIAATLPCVLTDDESLRNFASGMMASGTTFVLKPFWSSSGRSQVKSDQYDPQETIRRGLSLINKMGGIMGEQWIGHKQQDFAMLFYVGRHAVRWLGYSMFDNDAGNTYRCGYLLPNDEMERRIFGTSPDGARWLAGWLTDYLSRLCQPFFERPWQLGYVGIDMMTYRDEESYGRADASVCTKIHPCIEMNLRCTMGVVTRLWFDQHCTPKQSGRFYISPQQSDGHFSYRMALSEIQI